jgi:hypothetical protein
MFVNNQTLKWLESKDEKEKKVLIKNASRNAQARFQSSAH